jgi:flagellar protein FliS
MNTSVAMSAYRNTHAHSAVMDASPHKLISLLLKGAIDRVSQARGALERKDIAQRGELIGKAISIVGSLQAALDKEQGGEIAQNLDSLYDYMERRLLTANVENDAGALDEVANLLREIQAGWDAIAPAVAE